MLKLIHCTCGCGALKRAPLPPRAQALKNRRLIAAKKEEIQAKFQHAFETAQARALASVQAGPMQ